MPHMIPAPGAFAAGVAIFLIVLWDAFEAIILPRRVTRKFRLARLFYRSTWKTWRFVICLIPTRKTREALLGFYGPLSLLVLVGVWAVGLVLGFGLMQYGAGSAVVMTGGQPGFLTDIYLSGTTFFTLGLGDVIPRSGLSRALVVLEAGFGFGFLAAVIAAGELLLRHTYSQGLDALRVLLKDWELWCAELMESHLSYPVLAYFRSQHDNQSWIASLTAILDTCALVMVGIQGACEKQAELTFAIARHAVVDLSQVFGTAPKPLPHNRLPEKDLRHIRDTLAQHGMQLHDGEEADRKLADFRKMYEPYIHALANYLNQTLPPWIPQKKGKDNWQTTAWAQSAGLIDKEIATVVADDHF